MSTFNIITILIGLVTIIANICIAICNIGKNRKIYEIEKLSNVSDVNKKLRSGDYALLHLGQDVEDIRKVAYILGRVGFGRMVMNTKQLIVAWLMAITICFVWVGWGMDYYPTLARGMTASLISTHIVTIILGSLLIYTLRDKN